MPPDPHLSNASPLPTRVVIRADAASQIGSGHVTRCAALAEALRAYGAEVNFAARGLPSRIGDALHAQGIHITHFDSVTSSEDARATIALFDADQAYARWVVVDGYHFDSAYVTALHDAGLRVAWIDDLNADVLPVDLVVNPTFGAERLAYATSAPLLAGATYALVRRAFVEASRGADREYFVLTLGGADPNRLTSHAVRSLAPVVAGHELIVIVGPSNPHVEEVRDVARACARVTVLQDPPEFPTLIANASLVISAAGGTTWELAASGTPMFLLVVADNQRLGAMAMVEAHAAEAVDVRAPADLTNVSLRIRALINDADRLGRMQARATRIVDGRGSGRVARWIVQGPTPHLITMRAASEADALQVWRINSEPSTRAQSFHPVPLPLAHHFDWFDRYLAAADAGRMYVFVRYDEIVGVIRYDRTADPSVADLSFAVAAASRGMGIGARVLAESWRTAVHDLNVRTVHGYVLPGNRASVGAFRKAGFTKVDGHAVYQGRECLLFERSLT